MNWRSRSLDEMLRRARAARSSADRAVLIREATRLNGGQLDTDIDLSKIDPAQFRISCTPMNGRWRVVEQSVVFMPGLPDALSNGLANVLPIDPEQRRIDERVPADGVLRRYSPFPEYRNATQRAGVRAVCTMPPGAVLLARMSTGTGKSLLFQVAVRYWRERHPTACAVVLVPTIALALDQEAAAREFPGLTGSTSITSNDTQGERLLKIEGFCRGDVPLLFLSPEMALGQMRDVLEEVALPDGHKCRPPAVRAHLAGIFVDEVHIIATWGQSFRPDLQRIPGLIASISRHDPHPRTVLLSATVDASTQRLLREQYAESHGKAFLEIAERAPRREFEFVRHTFDSDDARDAVLADALVDVLPRPAIVYTTRVEHAQNLVRRVRLRGYERVVDFTGETDGDTRRAIVDGWRGGQIDLVVATSAFGMGIDQSFTRCIVHACVPEGASRYYQEIGRAGRDGYQSFAVMLDTLSDLSLAEDMAAGKTLNERALPRWSAMVQSSKFDPSDPTRCRWVLDLNASGDTKLNLTWNRSLLVQLQRYGALEVHSSPDDSDKWSVTPCAGYGELFDENTRQAALEGLFAKERVRETLAAKRLMSDFKEALSRTGCRVGHLFPSIEEGVEYNMLCGRCAVCRYAGNRGTFAAASLNVDWKRASRSGFDTEELVDGANDAVVYEPTSTQAQQGAWARFLVRKGVRQLIASVDDVESQVRELFEWFTPVETCQEALRVPTAVFMRGSSNNVTRRARTARDWSRGKGKGCVTSWVISGGVELDGRPLRDDVSDRAAMLIPEVGEFGET